MEIWIPHTPGDIKKELDSLPEYSEIAAKLVDTLTQQGLNDLQILRVLDLGRMDTIIKEEKRIREVL